MENKDVRLIDADELLDFINSLNFDDYNLYSEIFDYIDNAPTINAQPVKLGKWVLVIERFLTSVYSCTACGEEQAIASGVIPESVNSYCPKCGARMEVDEDEQAQ